jgi:uncharacterized phage infection (PIP) family protein YhgE
MNFLSERTMLAVKVASQALFLYGLFAWFYGAVIQITHPQWLPLPLSHLTLWIRLDTFTILSFFVSAFGFIVWRLIVELMKGELKKEHTD